MKLKLFILLTTFIAVTATAQKTLDELLSQYNTRSVPYISVEELRMLQLHDSVMILDTRELDEFQVSHIESANFVGFNTFASEEISEKIKNKNKPIIVYCSVGIRSEEIGEKLKKAGFTNVKNLYGGIFEWKNKAYPVLDSLEIETEFIHTFSKHWSQWLNKGKKYYKREMQ